MSIETPKSNPLRIAVMLDSWSVSAWIAKIIRDIRDAEFTELVLIILNKDTAAPRKPGWVRLLTLDFTWQAVRHALFFFYALLDSRFFHTEPDACACQDIRELCSAARLIEAMPLKKKFTDRFSAEDIAAIRACAPDVIIRFGFRIIRGEILSLPPYGVWSYHHGDNLKYRGTPDLFWEMCERYPVSGTVLQILTDALDGGKVIYRSQAATRQDSLFRQRNSIYWKAEAFIMRRLRDLHARGWSYITSLPSYNESLPLGKIYYAPTNPQMLAFLARLTVETVRRGVHSRLWHDSWFLAYRRQPSPRHIVNGSFDRAGFQMIYPPNTSYYADPCAITADGSTFVFFEEYLYGEQRGVISCLELLPDGPVLIGRVLDRPYHLSYPFVFEYHGEIFMAPESAGSNAVELYRATQFPTTWELCKVLIQNVTAVDPTLFEYDSRWWMFANIMPTGGSALDELHLFHADTPAGPWTPHPNNPVVSDVRYARPAGAVLELDGMLIRPAQDCSFTYGGAVVFRKIMKLTTDEYCEDTASRIDPPLIPGNTGIHTYTWNGGWEVIDCKRDTRK